MRNVIYLLHIVFVCAATGCASIPDDWGAAKVDELLTDRGHTVTQNTAEQNTNQLLSSPITLNQALSLALSNSPLIEAAYAKLGYGAANLYQSSRIRNPIVSLSILEPTNAAGVSRLSYGFIGSLTDLITLPARKNFAEGEFKALQAEIGATIFNLAASTEYAYLDYVTTDHLAEIWHRIELAARVSENLGQQFFDAGNLPPKTLAALRSAAASAHAEALSRQAAAARARTALANLLGVEADKAWQLTSRISLPVVSDTDLDSLLLLAKDSRLDLAAAEQRLEVLADRYGFTRKARWLGQLDVGAEKERESDGEELIGGRLEWTLPIFNQGLDTQVRAEADFKIAEAEWRQLALKIGNDVRALRTAFVASSKRAKLMRETLIPALIVATEQAQREQHYMLIGAFELLEVKQHEYQGYASYVTALRDYWLARTSLARAIGRALPSVQPVEHEVVELASLVSPAPTGKKPNHAHDHHQTSNIQQAQELVR